MVTYRNVYKHIYTYISLFCQLRRPRRNDTLVAMSKNLGIKYHSLIKGTRAPWRNQSLILRQRKKYAWWTWCQKVRNCFKKKLTIMELCQRDTGANWKSSQWPKLEQSKQQNKVGLDCNLNHKWVHTDITE